MSLLTLSNELLLHITSFFLRDDGRWDQRRLFFFDALCTDIRIPTDEWIKQTLKACDDIKHGVDWFKLLKIEKNNRQRIKDLARSLYTIPTHNTLIILCKAICDDDASLFINTLLRHPQALLAMYWPCFETRDALHSEKPGDYLYEKLHYDSQYGYTYTLCEMSLGASEELDKLSSDNQSTFFEYDGMPYKAEWQNPKTAFAKITRMNPNASGLPNEFFVFKKDAFKEASPGLQMSCVFSVREKHYYGVHLTSPRKFQNDSNAFSKTTYYGYQSDPILAISIPEFVKLTRTQPSLHNDFRIDCPIIESILCESNVLVSQS